MTNFKLPVLKTLLVRAAIRWHRDHAMRLSAAMAMYALLSLSPLLVITVKVLALILGEAGAQNLIETQSTSYLGPEGAEVVNGMITAAAKPDAGILATLFSLGVLMFAASGIFGELSDALNTIWDFEGEEASGVWAWVRQKLLSMAMVFVIGALLLFSLIVSTVLTVVGKHTVGEYRATAILMDIGISTTVVAILFAAIFRFLPARRIAWGNVALGAVVTALLFKVGQYLQALYFSQAATASAYGVAGSLMVVLLWTYYSCWIFFYGAELTQVYATRREAFAPAKQRNAGHVAGNQTV